MFVGMCWSNPKYSAFISVCDKEYDEKIWTIQVWKLVCLSDVCLFCLILNFSIFWWWRKHIAVCFLFITLLRWCSNALNTTITRVLLSNIHFCLISFLNDFFSRCFFCIYVFITILAIRLFNLCCCYVLMITLYLSFIRFSCLHNLINLIPAHFS